MKLGWLLKTTAIILLILVAFIGLANRDAAVAAQDGTIKIEGQLWEQLSAGGSADFIIRFGEQADLSPAYAMDWEARGEYVYNALVATASRSQAKAKAMLDRRGLSYQTFFAGNELFVWGGNQVQALELAAMPEIDSIRATRTYQIDPLIQVGAPLASIQWVGDLLANHLITSVDLSPAALDWGIADTKADDFWTTFRVRGEGIVVANIDTGVDYTHVALDQNYRCKANPASSDCWLDPGVKDCNGVSGGPCDANTDGNHFHGTHVMGTMAGDDDPGLAHQVGMAPNVQWIACLGCTNNDCTDFDLNTCADWILAPSGNPAKRPNVVNNSWGSVPDGDAWFLAKVNAWRASGIFPAFSAANSGPKCDSLGDPGSYQQSFASAAHDLNRNIANFSSRGPSAFGHDPYTKPNISAPGVSILSAKPGDAWQLMSGTSQASPHTAGAVALLWSCNPSLVGQVDATFQLLQNNAEAAPAGDCSAPPDRQGNYTYGYGYLDVLAAGNVACGGTLRGHVYDASSDAPIEGVTVMADPVPAGNQLQSMTDQNGYFQIDLPGGTYDISISKAGYIAKTASGVVISAGRSSRMDFHLVFLGEWHSGPTTCFDLTRFDAEYYPGTGLIYILGGHDGSVNQISGTIYSIDPTTGECRDTGTDMPVPIENYTASLVNDGADNLLCSFGGLNATGTAISDVQCYNPSMNAASVVTQLPSEYDGFLPGAQVVVANKVYLFGGNRNNTAPYDQALTFRYDPTNQSFTPIGDLSLARGEIDAAVVDGKIYAFGGSTFDGINVNMQTRTEVMADPGGAGTWDDAAVAELPNPTAEGQAFGFDTSSDTMLAGKVVISGGSPGAGAVAEVITYDTVTDSYDLTFPDLLNARRNQAGVFVSGDLVGSIPGRMWTFGGQQASELPPYMPAEYFEVPFTEVNMTVSPGSLSVRLTQNYELTVPVKISNNGNIPLKWEFHETSSVMTGENTKPISQPMMTETHPLTLSLEANDITGLIAPAPSIPEGAISLILDDGTSENNLGVGGTAEFLWVNRFSPAAGDFPFQLNQIQVYFDSSGIVFVGDQVLLVVYENINSSSDPAQGSNYLNGYAETVKELNAWNIYDLASPVEFFGPGDVIIGVITLEKPGTPYWPAAIDLSTPQGRSWIGWWDPNPLPTPPLLPPPEWGTIDSFGFQAGNWMVRGVGETLPVPWMSEDVTSGTVQPGESSTVHVTFDSHGLAFGDYLARLYINSNDSDTPVYFLPVKMTVGLADIFIPITYR